MCLGAGMAGNPCLDRAMAIAVRAREATSRGQYYHAALLYKNALMVLYGREIVPVEGEAEGHTDAEPPRSTALVMPETSTGSVLVANVDEQQKRTA